MGNLNVVIKSELDKVNFNDMNSVDRASNVIRDLIHDSKMPEYLRKEILANFKKLKSKFVAVRSSAIAEDSSIASWAGELESYLDTNEKQLLGNVKKCRFSLFIPRAIFYRNEKKLLDIKVSVAVVIQTMIESKISGITFTVHPVTENKRRMIIRKVGGGVKTVNVPKAKQEKQVLTGKQIIELTKICVRIEKHYRKPQDIEWAYAKGKFYIVQSRPVTTL